MCTLLIKCRYGQCCIKSIHLNTDAAPSDMKPVMSDGDNKAGGSADLCHGETPAHHCLLPSSSSSLHEGQPVRLHLGHRAGAGLRACLHVPLLPLPSHAHLQCRNTYMSRQVHCDSNMATWGRNQSMPQHRLIGKKASKQWKQIRLIRIGC